MKQETKGIIFALISALFFAIMSATVKSIPHIPIPQKIFYRNLVGVIIIGAMLVKNKESFVGSNIKLLTLRSIFGLLGVAANFYALSKLPLSDAVLLNKMSPFFVILFSLFLLKEKINKLQAYSLIIALLGAIFVIKPQFDYTIIPALMGLASAIFAASAYVAIRQLRLFASPETIVFFFSSFSVLASIPLMLLGHYVPTTFVDILIMLSVGISATIAQIFITKAYKCAPASEIAIYGYANIIFSTFLGIVIFGELPDLLGLTGGILIILAGFINYISKNRKSIITPTDESM